MAPYRHCPHRREHLSASAIRGSLARVCEAQVLSIDECRRYLGRDCELSDAAIEALRDQLYELTRLGIVSLGSAVGAGDSQG